MNIDTIIILIALLGGFIAVITLIINQSNNFNKRFDDVNNRITKLEIETIKSITRLEFRVAMIEHKLGVTHFNGTMPELDTD